MLGDFALDGELHAAVEFHQQSRSITSRRVNVEDVDEGLLRFAWFDIMHYTLPFCERFKFMSCAWTSIDRDKVPQIYLSDTATLTHPDHIQSYFDHAAKLGFPEGIVLRRPSIMYTLKYEHRQSDMVKKRKFQEEEHRVIGYKSGEGDREGCVVWHLQDPGKPHVIFWCDQVGDLEYQRHLFSTAQAYMGRLLTIRCNSRSKDGVPLFPHGSHFRDPADMAAR